MILKALEKVRKSLLHVFRDVRQNYARIAVGRSFLVQISETTEQVQQVLDASLFCLITVHNN